MIDFDYEGALKEGYTDEEILDYLKSENKDYDFEGALKEGYTPQEINKHLTSKPDRSFIDKSLRMGTQYALGTAENIALPYEIAVAPLASKEAQGLAYRQGLGEDIERLMELESMGAADDQDKALLKDLQSQLQHTDLTDPYVKTIDLGIRGLAEKATGLDLKPEGFLEEATHFMGFFKKPQDIVKNIFRGNISPNTIKAALPTGFETLRGMGAAAGYEMAKAGQFGPIGTIASTVIGDLVTHGMKGIYNIAKDPRKFIAETVSAVSRQNTKKETLNELIASAKDAGIELDAGAITNSDIIKWIQARVLQSGLSGDALKNYRRDLIDQFTNKYQAVLDDIGELSFENNYQAAEAIKQYLNTTEEALKIPTYDASRARSLQGRITTQERPDYEQLLLNRISPQELPTTELGGRQLRTIAQDIKAPIKQEFNQRWDEMNESLETIPANVQGPLAGQLSRFIREHEGSLLLGESAAEAKVVNAARRLRESLMVENALRPVTISDLIKTKRTLADIADWEFGGSNFKSAYKGLVGEIEQTIQNNLQRISPEVLEQYQTLNQEYGAYKQLFENKNVLPLFEPRNQNYNAIYNKVVSNPDILRNTEEILSLSQEGQQLLRQIKRDIAQKALSKPNLRERDIRDVAQTLGPEFAQDMQDYLREYNYAQAHPLPQAVRGRPLGLEVPITKPAGKPIAGRVSPSTQQLNKKLYEQLSKKTSDQILKQMDTVDGIRKLKRTLNLTPEGKKLFDELKRYKLEEMITQKITDSARQISLPKFANLFKSRQEKALAVELLGAEQFKIIENLQRHASNLNKSTTTFFNASQSGTVAADIGMISAGTVGILTLNPHLALTALGGIGGLRLASTLLSDKKFLKYLEQAVNTNKYDKVLKILEKMRPTVEKAASESGAASLIQG